ncbi:hypothetical protein FXW78_55085 [Rhodococcus opacus]|nr:hypothetical protein [Rhodococcus opacus]
MNEFNHADIGDRMRAIRESIAAKVAQRPKVDHNGKPIDPDKLKLQYDSFGRLLPDKPDEA